jgi:hypothetical protein
MEITSVIHLENVSVRYRVPGEQLSGVKEFAIRWVQRRAACNIAISWPYKIYFLISSQERFLALSVATALVKAPCSRSWHVY